MVANSLTRLPLRGGIHVSLYESGHACDCPDVESSRSDTVWPPRLHQQGPCRFCLILWTLILNTLSPSMKTDRLKSPWCRGHMQILQSAVQLSPAFQPRCQICKEAILDSQSQPTSVPHGEESLSQTLPEFLTHKIVEHSKAMALGTSLRIICYLTTGNWSAYMYPCPINSIFPPSLR